MISPLLSNPWQLDPRLGRSALLTAMTHSRVLTLELLATVDDDCFAVQAHPDFSPIGWHVGHIGYTESLWILERLAGTAGVDRQTRRLYAADGLAKADRQHLPDRAAILAQLADIRSRVETVLATIDLTQNPRIWPFLLQHESQHCETIAIVLALLGKYPPLKPLATSKSPVGEPIHIPAGGFWQGESDPTIGLDNEQPAHWVELPDYWIDATPVTCAQYQTFIAAGGYQTRSLWCEAGWAWVQTQPIQQPYYWSAAHMDSDHPVCGVSWYEASAYARYQGRRLPTEAEWEKAMRWDGQRSQPLPWGDEWPDVNQPIAANLSGMTPIGQGTNPVQAFPTGRSPAGLWDGLGNVWEWTDSWFDGYPGFTAFPYPGYSQTYFDQAHRVLRGGSWATRPWSIRSSFRNWYHPWTRVIFAGFRTCGDRGSRSHTLPRGVAE
jgi:gamma-glutamyl hercynylcysteine S-oxide synthase